MQRGVSISSSGPANFDPGNRIKILLVEDSPSDVILMTQMLKETSVTDSYDITDVSRLADAFTLVHRETFHLIMLDLNLLDINGVSSVAALHAEVPGTPIIVYSGMDDPKLKEKALMCGASHYLVKGRESPYGLKHMIEYTLAQQPR